MKNGRHSLQANRTRRGFSLLELLAVMTIMVMLSALAVTSYFAAVRGMARRGALKNLVNTLVLARQRACMESSCFSVIMFNEVSGVNSGDLTPSYIVAKGLGQLSYISGSKLIDEFTSLDQYFSTTSLGSSYLGAIRLYNLTRGGWSYIYPWVTGYTLSGRASPLTGESYGMSAFFFTVNSQVSNANEPSWEVGDVYGIEAVPIRQLPKNFWFTKFTTSASGVLTVTFLPDGRVDSATTISITEEVGGKSDQQKKSTISVASDGTITYDEKWN